MRCGSILSALVARENAVGVSRHRPSQNRAAADADERCRRQSQGASPRILWCGCGGRRRCRDLLQLCSKVRLLSLSALLLDSSAGRAAKLGDAPSPDLLIKPGPIDTVLPPYHLFVGEWRGRGWRWAGLPATTTLVNCALVAAGAGLLSSGIS
jgi:hypothetical protein